MDGNRRWAKEKHLPVFVGHQKGYQRIEKIVDHAKDRGIPYITFWAFSTENWNRNEKEVALLLKIFREALRSDFAERLIKKGGKIQCIGDLKKFPSDIQEQIDKLIVKSSGNNAITVTFALNYGGRDEIIHAVQNIISNNIDNADINEEVISQYLYTKNMPDPDLIIRTGGMLRLSGYLPWQGVYSELYFTDTYWPDFDAKAFDEALEEYSQRERRFGK
jgi:undecaprenyl diphosphate synthase